MNNIHAGILLISTRKYKQFVQPLLDQLAQYFLDGYQKTVFVFTDELMELNGHGSNVEQIIIPAYKFPFATIYRYRIFSEHEDKLKGCSHLVYLDVDSAVVSKCGEVFLVDEGLVAVRHPGFFINDGWGDSNNPVESKSYLPKEQRKHYRCGGCQAGTSKAYLTASKIMAAGIEEDLKNGVMPEHNDETFWNHYLHTADVKITELTPEYMMVEQEYLRKAWGIDDLPVKIIALAKEHKKIRE